MSVVKRMFLAVAVAAAVVVGTVIAAAHGAGGEGRPFDGGTGGVLQDDGAGLGSVTAA